MKIFKKGTYNPLTENIHFACEKCGCEFECTRLERMIKTHYDSTNGKFLVQTQCPECDRSVTAEVEG